MRHRPGSWLDAERGQYSEPEHKGGRHFVNKMEPIRTSPIAMLDRFPSVHLASGRHAIAVAVQTFVIASFMRERNCFARRYSFCLELLVAFSLDCLPIGRMAGWQMGYRLGALHKVRL